MAKEIFWITLVTGRRVMIVINPEELKYEINPGDTEREIMHNRNVAVVENYNSKHQVAEAKYAKFYKAFPEKKQKKK